jgi:hypoxanthine phosphoribosyltransferase
MNAEDNLLIVDDVYSSGLNVKAILDRLHYKMRKNMPQDIRIAVPWYRPNKNTGDRIPDYYIHQTDQWLVLPYELNGLTREEIRQYKGLGQLMDDLQEFLPNQPLQ